MGIAAVAFCPHPPLLVPAVGGGERVVVRTPAVEAVQWLAARPIQRIVVLGSGAQAVRFPPGSTGSFAGFGVDVTVRLPGGPGEPGPRLPLPLAVGAWLLEVAGWNRPALALTCDRSGTLPSWDEGSGNGLLVMGDGSARRSEKAPGWLDARSAGYDAAISAALASGDPALLATDLAAGAQLLAAGASAWMATSRILAGTRWAADVTYDDAPYGVGYLVATWAPDGSTGLSR
jgi:hypothetical protein